MDGREEGGRESSESVNTVSESSDPPPSPCSLTKQGHRGFGSTTQSKQRRRYLSDWWDDVTHRYQIARNCKHKAWKERKGRTVPLSW